MDTIKLKIYEQHLVVENGAKSVTGTVGILKCQFEFDPTWSGYTTKSAIFRNGTVSITKDILDNTCDVPPEVLTTKGTVELAIVGSNTVPETQRTETVVIINLFTTLQKGRNAINPTPDQYTQFVEEVAENADRAEAAKTGAETASTMSREAAVESRQAATEAAGSASSAASSASDAASSASSASTSASSAGQSATSAANSASAASTSASAASSSAQSAANSAGVAETAKGAAQTAKTASENARDAAIEAKEEAEEIIDEVVRYDDSEPSEQAPINADQLNGHRDTYFAKKVDVDTLTSDVDALKEAKHTHENKSILDLITQEMLNLIGTIRDKYVKPAMGIPKEDFSEGVKESLHKADNSVQTANLEDAVAELGFTKNQGTYIKPSSGIPKTDLAEGVRNTLTNADRVYMTYITYDEEEE